MLIVVCPPVANLFSVGTYTDEWLIEHLRHEFARSLDSVVGRSVPPEHTLGMSHAAVNQVRHPSLECVAQFLQAMEVEVKEFANRLNPMDASVQMMVCALENLIYDLTKNTFMKERRAVVTKQEIDEMLALVQDVFERGYRRLIDSGRMEPVEGVFPIPYPTEASY